MSSRMAADTVVANHHVTVAADIGLRADGLLVDERVALQELVQRGLAAGERIELIRCRQLASGRANTGQISIPAHAAGEMLGYFRSSEAANSADFDRAGKMDSETNHDPATERAGRPCAAAYLRESLHSERWNILAPQKILGHSSLVMTMRYALCALVA